MSKFHLGGKGDDDNPASASHRSEKSGDIITFGTYTQTAEGTDRTPIKWRVLQNSSNELFLLSESILDCKRYHSQYVDVNWRDCDLRRWLNDEFHNVAFNINERELINTTLCTDNGKEKPDTRDKVFLLSIAEVKNLTGRLDKGTCAIERRALGTEFAKSQTSNGCRLYVYDKSTSEDYLGEGDAKQGCSWWWLRTQPGSPSRAAFVGTRASIRSYGRVNLKWYGVRPALKLDMRNK